MIPSIAYLDHVHRMQKEFELAQQNLQERYQQTVDGFRKHVEDLCQETQSLADINLQDQSTAIKYRSFWIAAEYRAKQLMTELNFLTNNQFDSSEFEIQAQIPIEQPSPERSIVKRPMDFPDDTPRVVKKCRY
jgi:hypothetical protein